MGEWKRVKLSEVLKEKTERNRNNETDLVLSVTNSQGFMKQSDFFEGTVHSEDISNYKLVRKNEFAYNPSRINVGSIDILKEYDIGALSPMYVIFSVDETKLLPDYFKYYFQTHKFNENVKNKTQGSVRNSLSFKALSEFEYLLPPLEEQKRIVKILDQVNRIIEKYQNLINEKEQFIKSQFVEMFGNPNGNNKELEIVKLKDICENLDNQRIPVTSTNRTSGKYPYYGASGIVDYVNDYIFDEDLLLVSEDGANLIARVTPIAFSITGKAWVNNHAHVLRFKNKCTQIYVENFFENLNINQYITGITQPKLNQERLNSIEIPIPDIESQEKYMGIKKLIDKQKFELEKQKQNYIDLKKGLMQQLLTGKLKV